MASPRLQAPRRRTGLIVSLVAIPVVLIIAVVAVVIGLQAAHGKGRWTAVNHTCPRLDAAVGGTLGMAATPLPDDDARGKLDNSTVRHCYYNPGDDANNNSLQVIVRLYQGGIRHDSHGEAQAAVRENPPPNFHPIGPQSVDTRFGDRGTAATLTLITIPDNAVITVQLYDRDKLGNATEQQALALRTPLQAVADQARTNLG